VTVGLIHGHRAGPIDEAAKELMKKDADIPGRAPDQTLTEDNVKATPNPLEDDMYTKPNLNLLSTGRTTLNC